jgi:PTS system nitrogen regulatory IIA component
MDLKIKDVAELLNVSETTIRRWLGDGKIPAYRINRQYRFSRTEIEDWVLSQKLGAVDTVSPFNTKAGSIEETTRVSDQRPHTGNRQFSLYRALHNGGVYIDVPGDTKAEVIQNTTQLLAKSLNLDADVLSDLLLDREKLMPTGLNNGVGMPHARDFLLDSHKDVVIVVFPKKPIQDYGALDGKPVHSLFFLFASEDKRHLHLLAKIAHLVTQEEAIKLLKKKPSEKEVLDFIKSWEAGIQRNV